MLLLMSGLWTSIQGPQVSCRPWQSWQRFCSLPRGLRIGTHGTAQHFSPPMWMQSKSFPQDWPHHSQRRWSWEFESSSGESWWQTPWVPHCPGSSAELTRWLEEGSATPGSCQPCAAGWRPRPWGPAPPCCQGRPRCGILCLPRILRKAGYGGRLMDFIHIVEQRFWQGKGSQKREKANKCVCRKWWN